MSTENKNQNYSAPGERHQCPSEFVSLEAAYRFAEKTLRDAGFTTTEEQG